MLEPRPIPALIVGAKCKKILFFGLREIA